MHAINRRNFLQSTSAGLLGAAMAEALTSSSNAAVDTGGVQPPSVLLIMTDDQGYGDLSCHGNPVLKTPNLDRLYEQSVRLTQFHVCPVCSPTRACLMTGRYNYRTGVVDTYAGRSMMAPEEKTMALFFKECGYHTGIFGKWHLGDTWPLRPVDRGFDESLVHLGGGIAQPSDPEFYERENTYFNPMLRHNGQPERGDGYCTDVFADAAIRFMGTHREAPCFTCLTFNAPHTPLQVPEEDAAPYKAKGLSEETALVYGMIANLDRNIGRVLDFLRTSELDRKTIVLFMTDNGSQQLHGDDRYNAEMRGWKGSVYEGGIRVPCFIRRPEGFQGGPDIDRIAAHVDILPTLIDLCGLTPPNQPHFDGVSLAPLLSGAIAGENWPDRHLFFQWHRGDAPEAFKNSAVRNQRWKLVNGTELYDLETDPKEAQDVASSHPDRVNPMREAYQQWFKDVSATRGYAPVRIPLGGYENPVTLTRQDWRGTENWTGRGAHGYWEVNVEASGLFKIVVDFAASDKRGFLHLQLGNTVFRQPIEHGVSSLTFEQLQWNAGAYRLECQLDYDGYQDGARFLHIYRL